MKKLWKMGLNFALTLALVFTMIPGSVSAQSLSDRLGGTTQYDTAAAIAQAGWTTANTAIIAVGTVGNSYDALAAGPLAAQRNAPILLTEGNRLPDVTKTTLETLEVKNVFIVGGTGVISPAVEQAVRALGISVNRLAGIDAAETSVKIAREMGGAPSAVVLTGGKGQDALSVASIAAARNMPILYTNSKDALPSSIAQYLGAQKSSIGTSYIVGGPAVVSDGEAAGLPGQKTRLSGDTAYDTNVAVIKNFASDLNFDSIYLANGRTMVDALAGVPLAAAQKAPIVLTDNQAVAAADLINGKKTDESKITALGGAAVVSQAMVNALVLPPAVSAPVYPIYVSSFKATDLRTLKAVFSRSVPDDNSAQWSLQKDGTSVTGLKESWNQERTELTLVSDSDLPQGDYTFQISGAEISTQQNKLNYAVLTDPAVSYSLKSDFPLAGFQDFRASSTEPYAQEVIPLGQDSSGRSYTLDEGDILSVTSSDPNIIKVAKENAGWYMAGGDVTAGGNTADKSAVVTVQLRTLHGTETVEQAITVSPQKPVVQALKIGYDRIKFSKDVSNAPAQTYFEFATVADAQEGKLMGVWGESQYGLWSDVVPSKAQVVVDSTEYAPSNAFMVYEDVPCSNLTRYLLEINVDGSQVVKNKDIKVTIYFENASTDITVKILAP